MKRVLFVCVENSCRSQMAEGFAKEYGKGIIEAYSAGSKPSRVVNPLAIKVMQEAGVDISFYKSKGFNELPIKKFDYVVSLGCKDMCPFVPADKHIEWNIPDPKDREIDFFRRVRDKIREMVLEFIQDIQKQN